MRSTGGLDQFVVSRDRQATEHKLEVALPTILTSQRIVAKSARFAPMIHLVRHSFRVPHPVNVSQEKNTL